MVNNIYFGPLSYTSTYRSCLLFDSQFLHLGSRGNTSEMTFTNCRRDENSSFVERLSWTWVPPLSFSTTDESATVPAATTTGISNIA